MNFKIDNLSKIYNIINYLESKGGSSSNTNNQSSSNTNDQSSSNTNNQSSSNTNNQCVKGDISLSNCPATTPCYSKDSYLCYNKDGSIPLNILNPKKLSKEELSNLASIGLQKNLIEKKLCYKGYKYCDRSIQIGNCISNEQKCNEVIESDKKYQSDFTNQLLYLEGNKATNDNFVYRSYFKNGFIRKYKLPNNNLEPNLFLVQIDINRLKAYMGTSEDDAGAHNKIYTTKNIELLGWLLAGLHDQNINSHLKEGLSTEINTSFIKYYFTNLESHIKVPIIETTDTHKRFNIADGRHRLGFYNYFNINGFILTDEKGLAILRENNISIDHIVLVSREIDYFNKNIFQNIKDITDKNLRIEPKIGKSTIKCKICEGNHYTWHHSKNVKV